LLDVKYFSKKARTKTNIWRRSRFLSLFKRNNIWLYLLLMVYLKKI